MTKKQKKMLRRIIVAASLLVVFSIIKVIFSQIPWPVFLALFLIPYLIIGYDVLKTAAVNIIHGQLLDEKFLMALASIGAFATGEFPEAVAVILFFQVGELFESIAVGRTRKSVAALMDIRPDYANLITVGEDGSEQEDTVSPDDVPVGSIIVIKPGEKIPLDGIITEGTTTVNTSALTGESLPCDMMPGDKVISGTLNLTGVCKVRTSGTYSESTVARILELVENSSDNKSNTENFITRFAHWYTPIVVISALLLAVIPPLFLGITNPGIWSTWIGRALVFLVVSCPCALVVSVPLSFFSGIGGASRYGILIKGANYLEAVSKADTVVFDKTGTLTKGSFAVDDIHPNEISQSELLDIAALAESFSSHPIAVSVIQAHHDHLDKSRVGDVKEIAGKGVCAVIDGDDYYVGNGSLMDEVGAKWHECHLTGTIIHVARKIQGTCEYLGHIIVNDEIKPESAKAIENLNRLGISRTVMLTGDKEDIAENVASKINMSEYHAKLLPRDKVERVRELKEQGARTVFVGDGINDAPVLTLADVGIAMGAMGSDAAIESADIVLMDDDPVKVAKAVRISRKTMRIVKENIIFSLAVKAVILILGAFGIAGMWLAVFGDVGVLILAILNSLRCFRISDR
ncbi:MAG: cadmium-translocating P-type ATPase [Clostridiales bacterium]|nr:cadmium-translocating P-type ATPase [Clostridiales bacterium]